VSPHDEAWLHVSRHRALIGRHCRDHTVHQLPDDEVGVPDLLDADPAEHLAHDDLDVLVVDRHALESVDLLDLVDQVLLELLVAENGQDVVRVLRALHEWLAGADAVPLTHGDVLAARDEVLLHLAVVGLDLDLPHALDDAANPDHAVDLGDRGLLLRLARLEQLRDARQTPGDVLRLRGLARHLGEHVSRCDLRGGVHLDGGYVTDLCLTGQYHDCVFFEEERA